MPILLVLAALLAGAAPAAPRNGCVDVRVRGAQDSPVSLSGRLERHVYPGRPNYEDITRGDEPEPTFILVLDYPICIDDGGEFADPHRRFTRAHLFTSEDRLLPRMRAGVGHRIRIHGSGFASFTVHHHAPLVVRVTQINIRPS